MSEPRWIADEMVGRLARYLRFLGHDTEYARGLDDDEIARRAVAEGRRLLTRDRDLARRVPGAVLLTARDIQGQLRAVRAAAPSASFEVAFTRCTLCNALLAPWTPPASGPWPREVPRRGGGPDLLVYACVACGHLYWEGSHTARVRREVAAWLAAAE